jgi:predicted Zn finger-like uncharacterized protein
MFAQCPECLTIYKIRADALVQGRGKARCGTCGAEFDLLATLADDLPAEPFNTLKRRAPAVGLPSLTVPAARPQSEQRELFVQFDPTLRAQREEAPSFVRGARAARGGGRRAPLSWGWIGGTLAMSLLLAAQLAFVYREPLLARPRIHAWVEAACTRLHCRVPAITDRARIRLLAHNVEPHPSAPHALMISATLINDAPFAQTFPVVQITLSDVNEHRIAMRRFQPEEYLGDLRSLDRGMASEAAVTLSFEVEDPGRDAVAYEFQFL